MSLLASIRSRSTWRDILEGQPQNLGLTVLLAVGASSLLEDPDTAPRLLGLTSAGWAKLSIWLAVAHQILVAFVFRMQLHRNLLTRLFGDRDMRFWAAMFMPLLLARPLTVMMTGWADQGSLGIHRGLELVIGTGLLAVAIWAMQLRYVPLYVSRRPS